MGGVSKDSVLEFVDELESGKAIALEISHVEDVSGWVGAIREFLEGVEGSVSFAELVKGLEMPVVAVLFVCYLSPRLGNFMSIELALHV